MSEQPPVQEESRAKRGVMWWFVRIAMAVLKMFFVLLILLVLLSAVGLEFLEVPIRLLFGWCFFIHRSFPNVQVVPDMLASGLVALIAAGVGLHFFIRWFHARSQIGGTPWRWRSTFALVAVMLLLFAVSIGGAGVVHQLGWLKGEPFMENRGMSARTSEAIKARCLMAILNEWSSSHDETYPSSLRVLAADDARDARRGDVRLVQTTEGGTPEEWLYFGAGIESRKLTALPVIVSPRADVRGKRTIGLGDGSISLVPEEEFQQMIADLKAHVSNR